MKITNETILIENKFCGDLKIVKRSFLEFFFLKPRFKSTKTIFIPNGKILNVFGKLVGHPEDIKKIKDSLIQKSGFYSEVTK